MIHLTTLFQPRRLCRVEQQNVYERLTGKDVEGNGNDLL